MENNTCLKPPTRKTREFTIHVEPKNNNWRFHETKWASASTISVAKMRISAQLGFTLANWDISAIHGDVWSIYDRCLFTSKPMIGHSEDISTHVANQRYCSAPQAHFKKG